MRLIIVFRCVRSNFVLDIPSTGGFATVGTQSLSIDSTFAIRETFSIMPRMRTTANRMCLKVGVWEDSMRNHRKQQTTTVIRFVVMVRRSGGRREEALSIQRPEAPEKRSTQAVSAMPLSLTSATRSLPLGCRSKGCAHLMDEAVRFPGNADWMKRI